MSDSFCFHYVRIHYIIRVPYVDTLGVKIIWLFFSGECVHYLYVGEHHVIGVFSRPFIIFQEQPHRVWSRGRVNIIIMLPDSRSTGVGTCHILLCSAMAHGPHVFNVSTDAETVANGGAEERVKNVTLSYEWKPFDGETFRVINNYLCCGLYARRDITNERRRQWCWIIIIWTTSRGRARNVFREQEAETCSEIHWITKNNKEFSESYYPYNNKKNVTLINT